MERGRLRAVTRPQGENTEGVKMKFEKSRPLSQKTIGVLGGMSNQATGEYYRLLNDELNNRLRGWDNGEIVIVSVNFGNIEYFVRNDRWNEAQTYLRTCKKPTELV